MKTPANPFTIHVIEPQDVIPYVAPGRLSRVYRVRPYIAETLTRTGHGAVQTSRVAAIVVTALCRMIGRTGVGVVQAIRFLNNIALTWLLFVFIKFPLFMIGVFFLIAMVAFGWDILSGLYRGWFHLPRL